MAGSVLRLAGRTAAQGMHGAVRDVASGQSLVNVTSPCRAPTTPGSHSQWHTNCRLVLMSAIADVGPWDCGVWLLTPRLPLSWVE